jgi:hypothetical protein
MPSDSIKCPHCRKEILLSEAVSQQIREQLTKELEAERDQQSRILSEREAQLQQQQKAIESRQFALDTEVARQVREAKDKLEEELVRKVQADLTLEMQDLRIRLEEKDRKLAQAQQAELTFRQKQRELDERQLTFELEIARKLDAEKTRIRDEVRKITLEEQQLRASEKEKLIADLQKQIEMLRRKAEQGSQQLQGEVLEVELEALLQSRFPADEIAPVSTGVRGADLLQRVRDGSGQDCGCVIWETKRTRNWSNLWLSKLKEDQRAHCADVAVLLTLALPDGIKNFGYLDGVWVTDFACGLGLAAALRQGLIGAANARRVETGKKEKMEVLYNYLAGTEFRQKVEAIVEAFVGMKSDLDAEKRAMTKLWAKREKQIEQLASNTALLYGGVQGIVGQAALPALQLLELDNS